MMDEIDKEILEVLKEDKEKAITFLKWFLGVRLFFGIIGFIIFLILCYFLFKSMVSFNKDFAKPLFSSSIYIYHFFHSFPLKFY